MDSPLVDWLGWPATLIHGDTLVLDRWRWLADRLPPTPHGETVVDVGCGSGAFTIGLALRGYRTLGLSWDQRNQRIAAHRAKSCGASGASFQVQDVRFLDSRDDLCEKFDIVICLEVIEHILDDAKLLANISGLLKHGGRLLLTTPNLNYRAITPADDGPFSPVEDGGHVRRGYSQHDLIKLCSSADLLVDSVSYCSGLVSQKITYVQRTLSSIHPLLGWASVLPLRPLPPLLDTRITELIAWPYFSICLEAHRI